MTIQQINVLFITDHSLVHFGRRSTLPGTINKSEVKSNKSRKSSNFQLYSSTPASVGGSY